MIGGGDGGGRSQKEEGSSTSSSSLLSMHSGIGTGREEDTVPGRKKVTPDVEATG